MPEVDRQIIRPWLLCVDCTSGELERIVQRGSRLVPYLSAALRDGPTHAEDSLARMRAVESVTRANRYRQRHGGPGTLISTPDSQRAVDGQHDDFRLTWRLRAGQALFQIDSARARSEVSAFCASGTPELTRHPEYRASFKRLGPCP